MKSRLLILSFLLSFASIHAQEFQEISTGTGYNMQSYIQLAASSQKQVANNAWDISFATGTLEAGVFINESVGSTPGASAIQLYYTLSEDFSAEPDSSVFNQFPLYNTETSWSYGAFNEIRNLADPFDFGWGIYNFMNHEVTGAHVYVVRLREGDFKKIQIQSMINNVYTFRYANLNGTNEQTITINKADHAGKAFAYFSFNTETTVDVEPAGGFDMVFQRYFSFLPDGQGDTLLYLVTGILTGPGVRTAEAAGVDPSAVTFEEYAAQLSDDPEVIGHDWKSFNLGTFMWEIPDDLVYFVQTADDRVWKIQFVDFEGSSTGTATMQKEDLGIISGVKDPASLLNTFDVYPNPAREEAFIVFEAKPNVSTTANVSVFDLNGRLIAEYETDVQSDLNAFRLPVDQLNPGMYNVRLAIGKDTHVSKLTVTE